MLELSNWGMHTPAGSGSVPERQSHRINTGVLLQCKYCSKIGGKLGGEPLYFYIKTRLIVKENVPFTWIFKISGWIPQAMIPPHGGKCSLCSLCLGCFFFENCVPSLWVCLGRIFHPKSTFPNLPFYIPQFNLHYFSPHDQLNCNFGRRWDTLRPIRNELLRTELDLFICSFLFWISVNFNDLNKKWWLKILMWF